MKRLGFKLRRAVEGALGDIERRAAIEKGDLKDERRRVNQFGQGLGVARYFVAKQQRRKGRVKNDLGSTQ